MEMKFTIGEGKKAKEYTVILRWEDGTPFDPGNPDDMKKREKAHIRGRELNGWTYVPNGTQAAG